MPNTNSPSLSAGGLVRLLVLGLIWGTSFLWIKLGLESFSPPMNTVLRTALGGTLLLVILLVRREPLPPRRLWGHLLLLAVIGIAIPYTCFAIAEQTIPTTLAGAINSSTPLFTLLVGLVVGQRAGKWQIVGLVLGFVGTLVMMRPWDESAPLAGSLIALTAAALYGVAFVYTAKYVTGKAGALPLAAVQVLLASPATALALPFFGRPVGHLTWAAAIGVLMLGLLGTGVAYLLNYRIIADDGPLVASTVTYLLPVVAIIAGVVVLGEKLSVPIVAGIVITLAGIVLTRRR